MEKEECLETEHHERRKISPSRHLVNPFMN